MNVPTMEPLARRLGQSGRDDRHMKRAGSLVLPVIAAVVLMGQVSPNKAAAAGIPPRPVLVERDNVPVHSQMDTTSEVVFTLMRGVLVEIDLAVTSSEGAWCRVKEVTYEGRSGFVLCEWLGVEWFPGLAPPAATSRSKEEAPPEAAGPPEVPQATPKSQPAQAQTEKLAPKPMATVTEPEVRKEKRYTLQVATLVVERNALTLKKRLAGLGYTPLIRKLTAPITSHRVYGGEFDTREEADKTARRLDIEGFPTKVVETEGGTFRLEVGSSYDLNKAIDLAHRLQKKGYTTKIDSKTNPTTVYAVRIGEYENRAEAQEAVEALKKEGFTPLIVRP